MQNTFVGKNTLSVKNTLVGQSRKYHFSYFYYLLIFAINLLGSINANAGPWIDSGDDRLRHHIQLLADKNIITVPVTTWPLMWSGVISDVSAAKDSDLDEQLLWSLLYVKHAFAQQNQGTVRLNSELSAGSGSRAIRHFGDNRREKAEAKTSIDWLGDRLAIHLSGTYLLATDADKPIDGNTWRADGSYMSYRLGNWSLSAGAIDRWWGPGWHSSLTLSSNARPIPGLSLQRRNSDAFNTPWLSWIGPWQLTSFAGQLESNRHVPDAYFLGTRVSFKPFNNLEIALSRTAQWGGEGRPQSLSSLKELIIGNDNRGDSGIDLDGTNEPGNQQASIDARYSFALKGLSNAIYVQFTGEDEASGMPSRGIVQLGLESSFLYRDMQHRLIVEAIDTASESYSEARFNYSYEHFIYKSGYRYKRRPIGASVDNDSRYITLAMDHYLMNGHQISWSISRAEINRDSLNALPPAGSVFGQGNVGEGLGEAEEEGKGKGKGKNTDILEINYRFPIGRKWQASFGLQHISESILFNDEALKSGGSLALTYRY